MDGIYGIRKKTLSMEAVLLSVKSIVENSRSSCLCGHGEWCPACDGHDDALRDRIIENINIMFDNGATTFNL